MPRLIVQDFCGWPWKPTGGPVKAENDAWDPDPPWTFRHTLAALVAMERGADPATVETAAHRVVVAVRGLLALAADVAALRLMAARRWSA
jgi:hypothetical protein